MQLPLSYLPLVKKYVLKGIFITILLLCFTHAHAQGLSLNIVSGAYFPSGRVKTGFSAGVEFEILAAKHKGLAVGLVGNFAQSDHYEIPDAFYGLPEVTVAWRWFDRKRYFSLMYEAGAGWYPDYRKPQGFKEMKFGFNAGIGYFQEIADDTEVEFKARGHMAFFKGSGHPSFGAILYMNLQAGLRFELIPFRKIRRINSFFIS